MRYLLIALCFALGTPAFSGDLGYLDDPRCCVAEIKRDADGKIARRSDVLRAFRGLYPCPSTGLKRGACPGWNIDHTIPLACRGLDVVGNLQWLPVEIKRCPGDKCKDRWERNVYCKGEPQ